MDYKDLIPNLDKMLADAVRLEMSKSDYKLHKRFYTLLELSEMTSISVRGLRDRAKRGSLRVNRTVKPYLVSAVEVKRFIHVLELKSK